MARQRQDWIEFFKRVARPHGVRIRLQGIDSTAPESPRTEKRLIRIVKALPGVEPFALRRSYASGPTIIDCVFSTATVADELAGEIGAEPVKPPLGWTSARELVADGQAVRRIFRIGAEPRVRARVRAVAPMIEAFAAPADIQSGRPLPAQSSTPALVENPTAVAAALARLTAMSTEEQASALFKSMMGGG